jgi:hypothetical protein
MENAIREYVAFCRRNGSTPHKPCRLHLYLHASSAVKCPARQWLLSFSLNSRSGITPSQGRRNMGSPAPQTVARLVRISLED